MDAGWQHLLFISDRSGSEALWSVPIKNGKTAGTPSLVTSNLGNGQVTSKAVTRSGSYHYVLNQPGLNQIFIAGIDPRGRKVEGKAGGETVAGRSPSWSPDGKSLALKRYHPVNDSSIDSFDLVVHSLESGEEKAFPTALGYTGAGKSLWFHDGKAVLAGLGGSQPRNSDAYRVDLATGEWKQVPLAVPFDLRAYASTSIFADDKDRYVLLNKGTVIAVEISTGTEKQIFSTHPNLRRLLSLSQDRRTLAIAYAEIPGPMTHLGTISVEGGEFNELVTVPAWVQSLGWTKDGQTILFAQDSTDKARIMTRVMRISAQGGMPEFTGIEAEGWKDMDISPDGSRIAYSANTGWSLELWSLDNVTAALK